MQIDSATEVKNHSRKVVSEVQNSFPENNLVNKNKSYQLFQWNILMLITGVEPVTLALLAPRSNQLS